MPPKTIRGAIRDVLENLGRKDLDKFRSALLDRREEPRVPVSKVEDQDFLVITDVLVSTYCEHGAARVTLDLLKEIKCSDRAEMLESVLEESGLLPASQTSNQHFVDKHRRALIQGVNNVGQILDDLLDEGVINQECYDTIRALPTRQDKIREIYCGGLKGGKACKDIFFKSLEKYEQHLVNELKKAQ